MKRWLGRFFGLVIFLGVTAGIAAGAYFGLAYMRGSVESYQPLALEVAPAQSLVSATSAEANNPAARPGTTAPLTNRVVMVVVNGLTLDDVENLPALANPAFKNISAGGSLFTNQVQTRQPAFVTLLTGASLDLTGGLNLDPKEAAYNVADFPQPTPADQLNRYDHLFAAAKRKQFTTALFGTNAWFEAVPPTTLDFYTTFDLRQPSTDVTDNSLNFLKKKSANFTVIQLSALQQAVRDYGVNSPQAADARRNLNSALERLTSAEIELPQTTLIITGDWDETVRTNDRWTTPFLMVGQAVQPGEKLYGRQEDVASTVAALLGIEVPRHNQGRILSNMLSMPPVDLGEKFLALVEQRLALATAYRVLLGLPLPLALNDPLAVEAEKNLKVAQQNYRLGSYEGIEGAVDWILRYTRTDMEEARQEWFAQARWQRAILAGVLLLLPLLIFLIWRSALGLVALFAAALASVIPYAIYLGQGRLFSFNSATSSILLEDSIYRAAIALGISLVIPLILFDWTQRRRQRRSGRINLEYEQMMRLRRQPFPFKRLFMCCCLMLLWIMYFSLLIPVLWYYWRYGYIAPVMGTPSLLPEFSSTFMQFFALNHIIGFAVAIVPAPVVLAVLYWFKRKLRGDKSGNEEHEDDILTLRRRPAPTPPAPGTGIIKV
jgi:hypothetical protein